MNFKSIDTHIDGWMEGAKQKRERKKCRCSNRFDEIIVVVSHVSSSLSIVFFFLLFFTCSDFTLTWSMQWKIAIFFASSERKRQNRVMTTTDYGWGWGESAHFRGRSCLLHCQSIVCIDGYLSTFFPRIERSIIVHHVLLIRLYLSLVGCFLFESSWHLTIMKANKNSHHLCK